LPGSWRGWVPFGNGTVGDWTCHVVDPVFWALDLGLPTTIQATVKDYDQKIQSDAFPKGEVIKYEFPANAKRGPIAMHWYSGTEKIPRPPELEPDQKAVETGAVVIGDKGTSYGSPERAVSPDSDSEMKMQLPAETLSQGRQRDWLQAIRDGTKAGLISPRRTARNPLLASEGTRQANMASTGNRVGAATMQFTNSAEANRYVNSPLPRRLGVVLVSAGKSPPRKFQ
jgi:hypothetical protein